jgi:hypothetical protein
LNEKHYQQYSSAQANMVLPQSTVPAVVQKPIEDMPYPAALPSAAAEPQLGHSDSVPLVITQTNQLATRQTSTKWLASKRTYERYEIIFRSHHLTNTEGFRGPYEYYRLVYRYGYELGTDTRYVHAKWLSVEQAARPRWEERNPGTWDEYKATIQFAWNACRMWQDD